MGFGRCLLQSTATKKSSNSTKNSSNATPRHKPRAHCDSFYWDISSVLIKTACLATFFVVESPRRIVSFITRKPEPKPFFICSKWGYRMCACGHHYYDHQDVNESEKFFSTSSGSDQSGAKTSDSSLTTQDGTSISGTVQKGSDGFSLKGSSFKDIVQRIAEQAVANQEAQSPDSPTDKPNDKPNDKPSKSIPPETPKKKKRRRRWYWPF